MTARDEVQAALMAVYDNRYPDATPFQRGSVEFEYRKTLEDLSSIPPDVLAQYVIERGGLTKWHDGTVGDIFDFLSDDLWRDETVAPDTPITLYRLAEGVGK